MRIRLAVFDLDGVIFEHDSFFGQMYDKYDRWAPKKKILGLCDRYLKEDTERLAKLVITGMWGGLSDSGFWEIVDAARFNLGAEETFAELKRKGIRTMVLTSSVQQMVDKAKTRLPIDYSLCNEMEVRDGKITGRFKWHVLHEHKGMLLEKFCREKRIDLREVAFVGDNTNDISAAKKAGLSIAFNSGSEELKAACDVTIEGNDLREVLKHLL